MAIGNRDKFRLLLWKNWRLQRNRKALTFLEFFCPVLFMCLLVVLRVSVRTETKPTETYDSFNLNLHSYGNVSWARGVVYSPKTPFYDKIMNQASEKLRVVDQPMDKLVLARTLKEHQNIVLAAVQFNNKVTEKEFPRKFSYSLRFPGELRSVFGILSWETSHLYPIESVGSRNPNEQDGGFVSYLAEGFTPLQNEIAMSYLQSAAPTKSLPQITMQRYPYPKHIYDPLYLVLGGILSTVILLCFVYPCSNIVKYIVAEKEMHLKEYMKIVGVPNWIHWLAWFIKSFLFLSVIAVVVMIFLKIKWQKNAGILNYSSWTALLCFLLIYVIVSIFFCFMLAVFFTKANAAAAISGLLWFLTSMPYSFLYAADGMPSAGLIAVWCFISNTALRFALKFIIDAENRSEGLQWKHFFTFKSDDNNFPFSMIIVIMLLTSVLYMLICLYVEQIFPGELGVGRKWYFPLTKTFWMKSDKTQNIAENLEQSREQVNLDAYEIEPVGKKTIVQLKNLKKKFNNKMVVKGVSMNMYENEITVMLGHNSSGKTVLISMLTGMYSPTSGTAIINGYDIRKQIKEARKSLGYCPQRNVLFPELSVEDHLFFFGSLKDLKNDALRTEIEKYLNITELTSSKNVYAKKLSGGMKRKLSIAMALCGGTKVVICDEPSTALDPYARRMLWDLLLSEKNGRTILLTSHYMDEAERIGDRIAIMSEGQLLCWGTSLFLKKRYGQGYRLICFKGEDTDSTKVTSLLQRHIPLIQPDYDLGSELSYIIPFNFAVLFRDIFTDFEENSSELKLTGLSLSGPTMEDVFMKTGAENQDPDESLIRKNSAVMIETIFDTKNQELLHGFDLIKSQWNGLLRKKIIHTWQNKFMFLTQNYISIVYYVILSIYVARNWNRLYPSEPLLIDLITYPKGYLILERRNDIENNSLEQRIANEYKNLISTYPVEFRLIETKPGQSVMDLLLSGQLIQSQVDRHYLAAATIGNGTINAWFNNQGLHTAPLALNLVHKAMARAILGKSYDIQITNNPLPAKTAIRLYRLHFDNSLGEILGVNLAICMSFVTAFYIMFLIRERECRSKLLQLLSGVGIWTFWLTHFFWDFLTFSIPAILVIITLACFQEEGMRTFEELGRLYLLLLLFGMSMLPFTYAFSWLAKDPAVGFARIAIISIFMGVGLLLLTEGLHAAGSHEVANAISYLGMICPVYSLAYCINILYYNRMKEIHCPVVEKKFFGIRELMCSSVPICCESSELLAWKSPGMLPYIAILIFVGIFSLVIVIGWHYHLLNMIINKFHRKVDLPLIEENIDEDVATEKKIIRQMSPEDRKSYNLVVDRLTKYYGKVLTVNQISFCVKNLECFGLLGINGAGKTTAFKMLTGDESVSYGWIYIKGISLYLNTKRVRREFGFCPQQNALLEEFTGAETLKIFCYLHGVPKSKIKQICDNLAKLISLDKHIDKRIHKYSGGNKRKLSSAVAMVGNPSLIYMDEPTSSMDPASRRQIWSIISRVRKAGKSIVLTSHSMEECEALCTRLAIMVQGQFKCFGTLQHLKDKFSKGWILKVRTAESQTGDIEGGIKWENGKSNIEFLQNTEFEERKLIFNPNSSFFWNIEVGEQKCLRFEGGVDIEKTSVDDSKNNNPMKLKQSEEEGQDKFQGTVAAIERNGSRRQNINHRTVSYGMPNTNKSLCNEPLQQTRWQGTKNRNQYQIMNFRHKQNCNQMNAQCRYYCSNIGVTTQWAGASTSCAYQNWNTCVHCGRSVMQHSGCQHSARERHYQPSVSFDCGRRDQAQYQATSLQNDQPTDNYFANNQWKNDNEMPIEKLKQSSFRGETLDKAPPTELNNPEIECGQLDIEDEECFLLSEEMMEEQLDEEDETCDWVEDTEEELIKSDPDETQVDSLKEHRYDMTSLQTFIENAFHGVKPQNSHHQDIHIFHIPKTNKLSTILSVLEEHKTQLNIVDYSINETTLEEIFVDFAKTQQNLLLNCEEIC